MDLIEKIIWDYEGGKPLARIAADQGVSFGAVRRVILKAGLPVEFGGYNGPRRHFQRLPVVEAYLAGYSPREIAYLHGVAVEAVVQELWAAGYQAQRHDLIEDLIEFWLAARRRGGWKLAVEVLSLDPNRAQARIARYRRLTRRVIAKGCSP